MPDSIKTTRIALIVAAGLEFATAALLLFIFFSGAVLIGWGTERAGLLGSALLGATGVFLAAGLAAFGVADLVIASGIAKGRPWARIAGIAMAALAPHRRARGHHPRPHRPDGPPGPGRPRLVRDRRAGPSRPPRSAPGHLIGCPAS